MKKTPVPDALYLSGKIVRTGALRFETVPEEPSPATAVPAGRYASLSSSVFLLEALTAQRSKTARDILLLLKARDIYLPPLPGPAFLRNMDKEPSLVPLILNRMETAFLEREVNNVPGEIRLLMAFALGEIREFRDLADLLSGLPLRSLEKAGRFPVPKLWKKHAQERRLFFSSLGEAEKKALFDWHLAAEENEELWQWIPAQLESLIAGDKKGGWQMREGSKFLFGGEYSFLNTAAEKKAYVISFLSALPPACWLRCFEEKGINVPALVAAGRIDLRLLSLYVSSLVKAKNLAILRELAEAFSANLVIFDTIGSVFQVLSQQDFNSFVNHYVERASADFLITGLGELFKGSSHGLDRDTSLRILERMKRADIDEAGLRHPSLQSLRDSLVSYLHPNTAIQGSHVWNELYFSGRSAFQYWSGINFEMRRKRKALLNIGGGSQG